MSQLDELMMKHMKYLVYVERRPFTFRDFQYFCLDGVEYGIKHGTYRNKISILLKVGKVEVAFRSAGMAFYTLKGVNVGKPIPANGMGVSYTNPFYRFIQDLVLDNNSIHDIHLKFVCKDIWLLFSSDPTFKLNSFSKDIRLGKWKLDNDIHVIVTIHRTNTVTVVIGCSYHPFPIDIPGIIDLFNLLTRIEEKISTFVDDAVDAIVFTDARVWHKIVIPSYKDWIVTMWHFGSDSLVEYSGEKFSMKWKTAEKIMVQAYTKVFKNKTCRIRLERHEIPSKRFFEAIEDKLYSNNCVGQNGN